MGRLSCHCSLDTGFSYSLSFRARLSHEREDFSHPKFSELLQFNTLFQLYFLVKYLLLFPQKPESWVEDRPSSALW